MKENLHSIQDTLKSFLKNYNLETNYADYELKNNWHKILKKQLANVTEPVKLENNCLTIRVTNELWYKEILTRKKELLKIISESLDNIKIDSVKIIK